MHHQFYFVVVALWMYARASVAQDWAGGQVFQHFIASNQDTYQFQIFNYSTGQILYTKTYSNYVFYSQPRFVAADFANNLYYAGLATGSSFDILTYDYTVITAPELVSNCTFLDRIQCFASSATERGILYMIIETEYLQPNNILRVDVFNQCAATVLSTTNVDVREANSGLGMCATLSATSSLYWWDSTATMYGYNYRDNVTNVFSFTSSPDSVALISNSFWHLSSDEVHNCLYFFGTFQYSLKFKFTFPTPTTATYMIFGNSSRTTELLDHTISPYPYFLYRSFSNYVSDANGTTIDTFPVEPGYLGGWRPATIFVPYRSSASGTGTTGRTGTTGTTGTAATTGTTGTAVTVQATTAPPTASGPPTESATDTSIDEDSLSAAVPIFHSVYMLQLLLVILAY